MTASITGLKRDEFWSIHFLSLIPFIKKIMLFRKASLLNRCSIKKSPVRSYLTGETPQLGTFALPRIVNEPLVSLFWYLLLTIVSYIMLLIALNEWIYKPHLKNWEVKFKNMALLMFLVSFQEIKYGHLKWAAFLIVVVGNWNKADSGCSVWTQFDIMHISQSYFWIYSRRNFYNMIYFDFCV